MLAIALIAPCYPGRAQSLARVVDILAHFLFLSLHQLARRGTLQNQSEFSPIAHVFTSSKQPWFLIPEGVPGFEGRVGEQEELFRLWRERRIDARL
jgi:hypothetical protein